MRPSIPNILVLCFFSLLLPCITSAETVQARHAMVVSAESLATEAGVEVLKGGGNAIDAAVAVGFVLAVTFPEAGNLGGGGYMVVHFNNGQSTMIDFRERAPAAARRDMYLDTLGNPFQSRSLRGPMSVAVPGTPAGLLLALEKYGTKGREVILRRAIETAQTGFIVDKRLAGSLHAGMNEADGLPGFAAYPSSVKAFTKDGDEYRPGDMLRQPDLAITLGAICDNGADGFYRGHVSDLIVAEMGRGGGLITHEDLASYVAVERQTVHGSYRGYEVISAGPSSAGGIVLLQILNMLERFDLRGKGAGSAGAIHLFASVAQRAFADRSLYLGDPDFVEVPVLELVSKTYAMMRCRSIDSTKATPSEYIGAGSLIEEGPPHTTHYCVVDSFGNVVSVTYTLNDVYGSRTVVDGAGFFLNDEMDDFVVKPGAPNQFGLVGGEANSIVPWKRMLSSMTPTIVLQSGKPSLVLGARGGSRIPTAVAQVILNVVDFGMDIEQAVETPRVHHQWLPDKLLFEPGAISPDALKALVAMGYVVEALPSRRIGNIESILIDQSNSVLLGGPDSREGGIADGF